MAQLRLPCCFLFCAAYMQMHVLMASRAKGDQILLGIISGSASILNVVHLEVSRVPAELATPRVALEHSPP